MRPDTWYLFVDPAILRFFGIGLVQTVLLALAAALLAFAVAIAFALLRLSRRFYLRWPATAYVEGLRALPVLLLIVYFGIKGSSLLQPIFGPDFELPRFWAGVLGLGLYTSAVLAEIIRAGILTLPKGQTEAARALGLSYPQAMRHVVLPQALRLMVPAMMAQLTTVIKDTSLVATIGVSDLLQQGRIVYSRYFDPVEVFLFVAVIYFLICFTLSQLSRRLELGRAPRELRRALREVELRDQAA